MRKAHAAAQDLAEIISFHNTIRCRFQRPSALAHFVNENTIVRAAAVMEHHLVERARRRIPTKQKRHLQLVRDLLGPWTGNGDWPDVCMRTLFVLRHCVVHLNGRYRPRSLAPSSRSDLLPAFRRFCACVPGAKVRQGETLCLDARVVMTPILEGCRDYWPQ